MKKQLGAGFLLLAFFICFVIYAAHISDEGAVLTDSSNVDIEASDLEKDYFAEDEMRNAEPVIYIDLYGYQKRDEKTAYFHKGNPKDTFCVVNADTKETVYEGVLDRRLRGDFSELTESGTYYIEAPHIGRSHSFEILNNKYRKLTEALYEKMLAYANSRSADFQNTVEILGWILRCGEMYPETEPYSVFYAGPIVNTMPSYLEDSVKVANNLMDTVAKSSAINGVDIDTQAIYSATMSILYLRVLPYDTALADAYLNEAVIAYDKVIQEKEALSDEAFLFYGAARLYQSTGQPAYREKAESFLKNTTKRKLFTTGASLNEMKADEAYVYGLVAYLKTTYDVDLELCEAAMKHLMEAATGFNKEIQKGQYGAVGTDLRSRMLTNRLYVISVVEHVIVSQEYNNILKNAIHYLGGCNEQMKTFYSENGICNEELDDKAEAALNGSAYFYLLGQICESDYKEKESIRSEAMEEREDQ